MVFGLTVVSATEEHYDISLLCHSHSTGNHLGRGGFVDSIAGLYHIERTQFLKGIRVRIVKAEVVVVSGIFLATAELHVEVVDTLYYCRIYRTGYFLPLGPVASVFIADGKDGGRGVAVQIEGQCGNTVTLGCCGHDEVGAAIAEVNVFVDHLIARCSILQIAFALVHAAGITTQYLVEVLGLNGAVAGLEVQLLGECLERSGGIGGCTAVVTQHDSVGIRTDESNALAGAEGQERGFCAFWSVVLQQYDALLRSLQGEGLIGFTL